MEVLSEHLCQGWLEGYLLTGRHGLFNCYEAFIHIVDSMFNQHAKWLKVTREHPLAPADRLAQLPALARTSGARTTTASPTRTRASSTTSSTRRPRSSASTCRPTPTPCSSVADHCLRSRHYVNVIVAGKQPAPNWLTMDEAILHCTRGIGIWDWASNDQDGEPDVVHGLRGDMPDARDAGRRRPAAPAPARPEGPRRQRGRPDAPPAGHASTRTACPTRSSTRCSRPTGRSIFAYHGYPWLIHRLTYRRTNHDNLHVRGYKEEGTTTTPFDMVMLNDLDRFHLVIDVIDRVPGLAAARRPRPPADGRPAPRVPRLHPRAGEDPPEIRDWTWGRTRPAA